jgi:two-component system chemotaxis response regulator CheY
MGRTQISDDALCPRELLKIVKETKHEVVAEATTGDEAIELYRQVKPDLVLLDILMSAGKSTVHRMEALKRAEENPSANVVICNAVEQQVLIKEALRSGA